jgi:hypothetical protein
MGTTLHSDWPALRAWLKTSDADLFLDDAVLGAVELYAAQEILEDYGIELRRSRTVSLAARSMRR